MNTQQLQAILWLRWRLTANQFVRRGRWTGVFSIVLAALAVLGAAASGISGLTFGVFLGERARPLDVMITWHALVFVLLIFWSTGLLVHLQRSESIDLTRLLHLPVGLRQVFVFNYLLSLVSPMIVLMFPAMVGYSIGLTLRQGPALLLSLLLATGFVFALTAWTYCLRGWLAAIMVNKRRRQSIVVWITLVFVLIFQVPNLLLHARGGKTPGAAVHSGATNAVPQSRQETRAAPHRAMPPAMTAAFAVFPPAWVGYGTMRVMEGDYLPALAGIAGSGLLGLWGIGRAYRVTLKFYQGAGEGPGVARARPEQAREQRLLVERRLPFLAEDTAGLLLATIRGLLRAPELKMALLVPLFVTIGGFSALTRGASTQSDLIRNVVGSAAILLGVFSFVSLGANMFGLDRGGFRGLVLMPVERWRILVARNLALLPFALGAALVLLGMVKLLMGLRWDTALASACQFPIAFFSFTLLCNWLAILFPYRLKPGTIQASKATLAVFVVGFASTFLLPLALVPMGLPGLIEVGMKKAGWSFGLPINLLLSAGISAVFTFGYWTLVPHQGRLLQRRERTILQRVTEELE